jgi:glutamine amidotransferase
MSAVTVVDYGAGNLLNVVRALEHCGASVDVVKTLESTAGIERLVLPGVGAFADCMQALTRQELIEPLKQYIASGKLFLGICVGMQVMFEVGEEFGEHAGLGIIPGRVVRIPAVGSDGAAHKIPHIGWSRLQKPTAQTDWKSTLLAPAEACKSEASVYFVHSYMGVPEQPEHRLAEVDYNGVRISAAVRAGNAFGVQFHPEKSGELGLQMLKQFLTS